MKIKELDNKYDEKRDSHREPVHIAVDYAVSGQIKNEFIKNLSTAGIFIETNDNLDIGDYIVLTYTNPIDNEDVKIAGVVVRKEKNGVGVKLNPRTKFDKEKAQKKAEKFDPAFAKKIWGPWATVGFGLAIGFVWFLTQVLVMGISVAAKISPNSKPDIAQYTEILNNDTIIFSMATCIAAVVCIYMTSTVIRFRKGASFKEYLGLHKISVKTFINVLGLTIGFIILSSILNSFFDKSQATQFMLDSFKTITSPILFYSALIIAAPVAEEIFFRGFLLEGFRHTWIGNTGAIILTALAWAMIHQQYNLFDKGILFILGLLLGVIRVKTGSLIGCFVMHAFNNLIATVMIALYINSL
ncbi:MAG: CPBP family intramembrane metalloprotease [Bacteroidetes bacterium]|nr:CPBP family intramembrane metalloprotease [Bacteroidota bacterium]